VTDSQAKSQLPRPAAGPEDLEIDLFDYLLVIWRARWSISLLCILAMAVTVVIVLTRPRYYESSVTIVPPLEMLQKELGAGSMGSLSNPLLRNALSGLTGSVAGIYMEILSSREVADSIIDECRLMEAYEDVDYRADARKILKKRTRLESTKDGVVKITVRDRDPNRAAAVTSAYVAQLDRQNKRLSGGQATSKRVFLEGRLREVEQKLSRIESIPSREARIQETLYELLIQQYEVAKIEEARSMPTIQVLDPAVVPELPVPRGTVTKGVLAGVMAFLLGTFGAFTREYVVQARSRQEGPLDARKHGSPNVATVTENRSA